MTTILNPIKEEEGYPSPKAEPSHIDRVTVATETESNDTFSVDSIPFENLEYTRRNLKMEVELLEYEFRQLKEALYKARCAQVNRKLEELRRSEALELDTINDLVDSLYNDRKQVAKHRRDFQLESTNKEYDSALQTAMNDFEESIRTTRDRIRERLKEAICNLQVEYMMKKRAIRRSHANISTSSRDEPLRQQNAGLGHSHHYSSSFACPKAPASPSTTAVTLPTSPLLSRISPEVRAFLIPELIDEEEERAKRAHQYRLFTTLPPKRPKLEPGENGEQMIVEGEEIHEEGRDSGVMDVEEIDSDSDYLPGPDLEPRRKPVILPTNTPCFIYNLAPDEIDEDLKKINEALKIWLMRFIFSKRGTPRISYSETASFVV